MFSPIWTETCVYSSAKYGKLLQVAAAFQLYKLAHIIFALLFKVHCQQKHDVKNNNIAHLLAFGVRVVYVSPKMTKIHRSSSSQLHGAICVTSMIERQQARHHHRLLSAEPHILCSLYRKT